MITVVDEGYCIELFKSLKSFWNAHRGYLPSLDGDRVCSVTDATKAIQSGKVVYLFSQDSFDDGELTGEWDLRVTKNKPR